MDEIRMSMWIECYNNWHTTLQLDLQITEYKKKANSEVENCLFIKEQDVIGTNLCA